MSEAFSGGLLEREDRGDVTVVRVHPPRLWDDATTEDLFRRLHALIEEEGCRKLVLNLAAVEYFGSATLGKFVLLLRKARAAQARLVLCNVTPGVARLLQVTHLADLLLSYPDEREALGSFA
jgi:anti-anti-sigma factor